MRKEWRIKPCVKLAIDKEDYIFSFLPTIIWMPWRYRYPGTYVVDFSWLIFHMGFGIWERRRDKI